MTAYATVQDVINLKRTLTSAEITAVTNLLPIVSDMLRYEAEKVGKNLDDMMFESSMFASVLKSVTVDIVFREVSENASAQTNGYSPAMSQMTQSALGYSVSGTFANAGGGLFIKKSELKRLGLTRQRYGFVDMYGLDQR